MELSYKPLNLKSLPTVSHLMTAAEQAEVLRSNSSLKGFAAFTQDGIGVGFLLYSQEAPGLIRVESLVVTPSRRRCGIGTAMLQTLCALGRKMDRQVFFPFSAANPSDPIYHFLASTGLFQIVRQQGSVLRVDREGVTAVCKSLPHDPDAAKWLLSGQHFSAIAAFARQIAPQYPAIARSLTRRSSGYSRRLSYCQRKSGDITAVCLMRETGTDATLHLLYAAPGPNTGSILFQVLVASLHAFCGLPELESLTVPATNPGMEQLIAQLFKLYQIRQWLFIAHALDTPS